MTVEQLQRPDDKRSKARFELYTALSELKGIPEEKDITAIQTAVKKLQKLGVSEKDINMIVATVSSEFTN
jgi:DNA-binding SARP family transcriptional activator